MGYEWTTGWLFEIAEIVMGQSPPGDTCRSDGLGTPLLNGPTEFGPHHPVLVQFTTKPKKFALKGDVLFCVRGSTTGRMNWADQKYAIGRGVAAIRHKKGLGLRHFVRSLIEFRLPELLAAATGSTFPNVSRDQLVNLPVEYPGRINEQRAIAHILGTLDDKIELNRQMNQTLEAMARAIFKSWFVDFDPVRARADGRDTDLPAEIAELFPDRFEESELGEIPKGWQVKVFKELITVARGLSYKGSGLREDGGGIPLHNLNSVYEGGGYKHEGLKFYVGEYRDRHLVSAGDLIVTNTEQGFDRLLIGYAAIVPE
ncbi:restriction endonuclease subunit S, partial [bacterium]|nr:restriction endonuclease subunit S [bacterium]